MGISKLGYRKYWTDPMPQNEIDWLESTGHIDTIPQLLKFIERYRDRIAVSNKEFKKTYKELLIDISKARSYLIKQQIKQNDIVALQMNNEYLFIVLFLAITSLGAIADVFPNQMPINLVQTIYSHHKIKLIIYSEYLKNNYVNFPFKSISANNATDDQLAPPIEVDSNSLAALYFTGGTIGKPKAVMMSHKNLMRGMTNGAFGFKRILYVKYLTVIPFFHIFGLVRNLLTPLFTGSENYLCEDFKSFLPNMSLVNPNIICITPSLLEMICYFGKQNIKSIGTELEAIVVGGATVSSNLMKQANDLKIYTCQGYGLTETANLVCGNRFPNENPTSVGQIFDFQEIKIVNNELWIKGENISVGYYLDDQNTKAIFENEWFKTGDLVRYENDNLYIIGRIKNLIVLKSGEKFSPEEIEDKFNDCPLIKDSLVYLKNEQIVLEVFPRETHNLTNDLRNQQIQEFFKKTNVQLPTFMSINKFIIRTIDFKRSPALKILRNQ